VQRSLLQDTLFPGIFRKGRYQQNPAARAMDAREDDTALGKALLLSNRRMI
jgi:hypothetical protein